MKYSVIIPILLIGLFQVTPVGAEAWILTMDGALALTQNAYSDNWEGGEAGSASWALNVNAIAEKQLTGILNSRNNLKLAYGQTYNQDPETDDWGDAVKSTDLIDFESLFRFNLDMPVEPYVAFRVLTQFYDLSNPDDTHYLNPATLTESAGIAKTHFKEDGREWISRLGLGARQLVQSEFNTQLDGGLELVSDFKSPFADDRILLTSKLTLFKAFFNSEKDNLNDDWKALDMNWENILSAVVTSHVSVNLYLQLLFDKQIADDIRLKQTLALGLTYKFI